jgi:hypothetical protein
LEKVNNFYENQLLRFRFNQVLNLNDYTFIIVKEILEVSLVNAAGQRTRLNRERVLNILSSSSNRVSSQPYDKEQTEGIVSELLHLQLINEEDTSIGKVYEISHELLVGQILAARSLREKIGYISPEFSHYLILENKKSKSRSLDLSNTGMKEIPDAVTELTWLEELIAGGTSYFDSNTQQLVETGNNGEQNIITRLPKGIGQ